ncbi:2-hydroxymuconate tautomerase [Chloroflexota bacterium]
MPLVTIDMLEGRTVEQKKELVESLTQLISEKIDTPTDHVTIIIRDVARHNWASRGKLLSE